MEGSLASEYHGVDADLRNLYRAGSGMTPRRLLVLIQGLSADSWLQREIAAAEAAAELTATADKLRERTAHYNRGG